jgi:hypothetical protein
MLHLGAGALIGLLTALPVHAAGPAEYRCGGIGVDDAERMKSEAAQHDLLLTFASHTGAYLADVAFEIRDARGTSVLAGRCEGPLALVDLPAGGNYRVTARFRGMERQQVVAIQPGRVARSGFMWPVD